MKKTIIFFAISTLLILVIPLIYHSGIVNPVIFSNSFFIVGIVLMIAACFSRLVSWSIHKRFVLDKLKANIGDIDKAKSGLKLASNYMFVMGSIYLIASLILAIV